MAGVTGGASIPIGASLGQAWEANNAEGKAKKELQGAAGQQAGVYAPYNTLGTQAASSLAGYLGLPGLPAGAGPSGQGAAPLPGIAGTMGKARDLAFEREVSQPQTLAELLARQPANVPRGTAMSRPQTPSAKGRSSYRAMEAN